MASSPRQMVHAKHESRKRGADMKMLMSDNVTRKATLFTIISDIVSAVDYTARSRAAFASTRWRRKERRETLSARVGDGLIQQYRGEGKDRERLDEL